MAKQSQVKVIWSNQAFTLLLEIVDFIAGHIGEQKANEFQQNLINFTEEKLTAHPERYAPCRFQNLKEAGCRCFTYERKYVVVYLFDGKNILIIGVVAARRNPKVFEELI